MQIKTSFHDEKMSTRTRFEREAKDNSEMAHCHVVVGYPYTTGRLYPPGQLKEKSLRTRLFSQA